MRDYPYQLKGLLFAAAANGDCVRMTSLLSRGVPADIVAANGVTPLMKASAGAHLDAAKGLVSFGANVNAVDHAHLAPLTYAASASFANDDLIDFLVRSGADVDQRDELGRTALVYAAMGHVANLKCLLRLGADPNTVTFDDETPLTFSIVWNRPKNVRALIEGGADREWKDGHGWAAIDYARESGSKVICQILEEQAQ